MVEATDSLSDMINTYVQNLSGLIRVERVILYGSRAKGEALKNSDIDLVVISDDFRKVDFLKRLEMLELKWPFTLPLEALGYTAQEFADFSERIGIVGEIKKSGKEIYQS